MTASWRFWAGDEDDIVAGALAAVTDGPFVRWPRRQLLATPEVVGAVRAAWPELAARPDDTFHVVSKALAVVTSEHRLWSRWPEFFGAPPPEVRAFRDEWIRHHGDGSERALEVPAAALTSREMALIGRTVRQVAERNLAGLASWHEEPGWEAEFFGWADGYGEHGRVSLRPPPGDPVDWCYDPVLVIERDRIRLVNPVVDMYADGIGRTELTLEFQVDSAGDPPVVLDDLHVL